MIKIGVVLPEREPFSPNKGGALATWVMEVFEHLKEDVDPVIFSPKTELVYPYFKVIQIWYKVFQKIALLLPKGKFKIFVKDNFYPFVAALFCKLKGLNIIHIHNRPAYVLIFRMVLPKARIILHMHNDHLITSPPGLAISAIMKSNYVVSVSYYIQDGIRKLLHHNGIKNYTPLSVVYNGANPETFIKDEQNDQQIILFCGRLIEEKGVLELIKAFVIVLKSCPDAKLVIIGGHHFGDNIETEYIKKLKEEVEVRGLDKNILFTGFLPHAQVQKYYAKAAIFACPSIWNEPLGMVVIEAMAAGLSIVASSRGGIPEVLADSGIIVNPENTVEFADKLIYLLKSPAVMRQLGEKARMRFEQNFTWKQVASDIKQILL